MGKQVLTESVWQPGLNWASESQVLTKCPRTRPWLRASENQVCNESIREPVLSERPRARSWLRASESQVLTERPRAKSWRSVGEPGLDWELPRTRSWLSVRGFIEFPASGFRDWNLYGKRRTWSNGWRSGSYFRGFSFMSRLSDQMLCKGLPWLSSPPSGKYRSRTSSDISDDLFHIFSNSSFTQ